MSATYRLGWTAVVTIIALRVGVGMHFFGEGANKLKSDRPFSQYFLANAKGPLASHFHNMIWDREGRARLGYALDDYGKPTIDLQPTLDAWDQFRSQIIDHYGLTDEGHLTAASDIVSGREDELRWYIGDNEEEIIEYLNGLDRAAQNETDPAKNQVPSLWAQKQSIAADMQKTRNAWLGTIDKIWAGVETDLNQLGATVDDTAKPIKLQRLARRPLDSVAIDQYIPWFDLTVGSLLIVGLFTRLAALSAGLFLLSVCLSQWPTALGAQPIWYPGVEMLACFALMGLAAGRFGGLDSILHNFRLWCCPPKETSYE